MKILVTLFGIWLVVIAAVPCLSQTTVTDRDGYPWECRPDESFSKNPIYTTETLAMAGRAITVHQYDVTKADAAGEMGHANDHKAICIGPEGDYINWNAESPMKRVSVTITPVTNDPICHPKNAGSNPPFKFGFPAKPPLYSLSSGPAAYDFSLCAFDVKYTITAAAANGGEAVLQGDPHIIVTDNSLNAIIEDLQKQLTHLQSLETKASYKQKKH